MNENKKFAEAAHPHSWIQTAENLGTQAHFLRSQPTQGILTQIEPDGTETSWDNSGKAIYLLAGFSLENAIKAFLVYENPHWVSNGKLCRELRSHDLLSLHRKSKLIPYRGKNIRFMREFSEGMESWARYPCGLSKESTSVERSMSDKHWDIYCVLIRAYGLKMLSLLEGGWEGPHDVSGYFRFKGKHFSFT